EAVAAVGLDDEAALAVGSALAVVGKFGPDFVARRRGRPPLGRGVGVARRGVRTLQPDPGEESRAGKADRHEERPAVAPPAAAHRLTSLSQVDGRLDQCAARKESLPGPITLDSVRLS